MSCGNKMHADSCPCDNDVVEEPQCEVCGSEDDVQPYRSAKFALEHVLCVACTAKVREEEETYPLLVVPPAEEATPEPVIHDEPTERIPVESMVEVVTGGRR